MDSHIDTLLYQDKPDVIALNFNFRFLLNTFYSSTSVHCSFQNIDLYLGLFYTALMDKQSDPFFNVFANNERTFVLRMRT